MAAVLTWAPPSSGPLSGCWQLYKVPFPLGSTSWEHMPPALSQILSWRRVLPVGWWRPSVASVMLVSCLCRSCQGHTAFGKAPVGGVSSSLPAPTSDGEVASRLLAQPVLRSKPASLAQCRGDPWDVSRQMALPLAYPDSHPHDSRITPEAGMVMKNASGDDSPLR
jgi:hypothetical protein